MSKIIAGGTPSCVDNNWVRQKKDKVVEIDKILNLSYEGKVVGVNFSQDIMGEDKTYYYKTDVPNLSAGDLVVVKVKETFKVVVVVEVTDETALDVDFPRAYGWVVSKVESVGYELLVAEDEKLKKTLISKKRKMVRQQMLESLKADNLLADSSPENG